jgi:hypothetical protein
VRLINHVGRSRTRAGAEPSDGSLGIGATLPVVV